MNSSNSPMSSRGSFGEFVLPQFSPVYTSSPRGRNDSNDFIPFGPSRSPGGNNRGRGRWRGRNQSFLSNTSTSSGPNSFSPGMAPRSSPYNLNSPRGHWRGRGNKGNIRNQSQTDRSLYYHPSMLEDPWAKLEEKLEYSESLCSSSSKTDMKSHEQTSDTESSVENEQSIGISSQESVS